MDLPQRKVIRLQDYDYSKEGIYFVTICCFKHKCLFGKIKSEEFIPNKLGENVIKCWREIPNHFLQVILHEFVVMPNHFHGIIEIYDFRAKDVPPLQQTLGSMIKGFKIGVTKAAKQFDYFKPIWQRSYYEHIVRNQKSHEIIADYILENPINWEQDKFFR